MTHHLASEDRARFLARSEIVDFDAPAVAGLARALRGTSEGEYAFVRRAFEFVRDEILHSSDHRRNPVTLRASDVLEHRTGFCYAKSHLLVALLRAEGVPAGFSYQRLSVGDSGPPYCLHGLVTVFLSNLGPYRIDPRGNRAGIVAEFSPPVERLAFPIRGPEERDLAEVWAEPHPAVVRVISSARTFEEVLRDLPDA